MTICNIKGADTVCSKCGRMAPDICPLEEGDKSSLAGTVRALTIGTEAPEGSQEPAGDSETPEATEVAEASDNSTTESPAKARTRKGAK